MKRVSRWRANTAFQPTRCASLALRDRWHFESSTDLLNPYSRSGRLNAGRWAAVRRNAITLTKATDGDALEGHGVLA